MSFHLYGKKSGDLRVNNWNWLPTLTLLGKAGLLDDEQQDMMQYNATGAEVTPEQAVRIAAFLARFLERLGPGSRVLLDLSVTDEPDTFELFRDEADWWRNYSASREWLVEFKEFCEVSGGFEVS